jgi:opacity protein-like surface antigen
VSGAKFPIIFQLKSGEKQMKNLMLVFVIAFAFCTTAMAADIAFYVGPPNPDGWYDAAAQTADVATIIAESGSMFGDISQFDGTQLTALGAWVDARTDDGKLDIIWLNGTLPSVLYGIGNTESDGSRAEEWLDGGNIIINVGDWFGYTSYEGGARQENTGTGANNILDISGTIAGEAHGSMDVTPAGAEYLPSLNAVAAERPIIFAVIVAPWEVAEIFG